MTIETRHGSLSVHLSWRDWLYIAATIIGIVSMFFVAYLRHDRMLTELVSGQRMTEHRLNLIERKIDP